VGTIRKKTQSVGTISTRLSALIALLLLANRAGK
jgi:hypothetical protein